MTIDRRSFIKAGAAGTIFLPFVAAGSERAAPTETLYFELPRDLTAHLENPQAVMDGAGIVYMATRPSSGVGGLVWKQFPDGRTELALPIDPNVMYALGEFQMWPDGYLRYVTIEKVDHSRIVVIPLPGWTPWPQLDPNNRGDISGS